MRDIALEKPQERKGRVVGPTEAAYRGHGLRPARHGIDMLAGDEFTVRGINPKANRRSSSTTRTRTSLST